MLDALLDKDVLTMWSLDASVNMGPWQSSAVGPRRPETESAAGPLFRAQLRKWGMALPAVARTVGSHGAQIRSKTAV